MNRVGDMQQLLRLRGLQVRRAREICAARVQTEHNARLAVADRESHIVELDTALDSLAHRLVHDFAGLIPRFAQLSQSERARLLDRREREHFLLADEHTELADAITRHREARDELARTLAREQTLADLTVQAQREAALALENKTDQQAEDELSVLFAFMGRAP